MPPAYHVVAGQYLFDANWRHDRWQCGTTFKVALIEYAS